MLIGYSQTNKKFIVDSIGKYHKYSKDKSIFSYSKKGGDYSAGFRIAKDTGYVYMMNTPTYTTYIVKYQIIKKQIELITNKKFSDSTIFLIHYAYLDDPGPDSTIYNNYMKKSLVRNRKIFLNPIKRKIEKKYNNLVFIHLFEEKIVLMNKKDSKKEYFFNDINNFFRTNLFLHPTLCGSYCLIKPNSEALVRNGEYSAEDMAEHLQPKYWNQAFPNKNE